MVAGSSKFGPAEVLKVVDSSGLGVCLTSTCRRPSLGQSEIPSNKKWLKKLPLLKSPPKKWQAQNKLSSAVSIMARSFRHCDSRLHGPKMSQIRQVEG